MKMYGLSATAALFLALCSIQPTLAQTRTVPVLVVNPDFRPVPVTVVDRAQRYVFVGFSDEILQGTAGLVALYAACQSKFGPDSRMCTSQEVLNSTTLSPQTGEAWVHPVFTLTGTGDGSNLASDVSGIGASLSPGFPASEGLTCRGWSTSANNTRGLTVNGALSFARETCDGSRSVTCCILQ